MPLQCLSCQSPVALDYRACPKCGEPISEFAIRHQEEPLDGKYRIVSMIGAGGMGEVYKVEHIHLHSYRVIKLMRPNVAARQEGQERFAREARLATRIQHPNVATLHDFAMLPDGSFYMVWEYIEGTTLTEVIRKAGRLTPRFAAEISIEALDGLDAIHRAGIVHRDISPDNVMITVDGAGREHVKIIDLGIAKPTDDDANQQTRTGMFVGKWKYGSPEHFGFLPVGEKIDGRADIYCWGILMYEMLSGAPPFVSETPQSYIMKHARESPPPFRVVSPSVDDSPELEVLIFRALEKDRKARFQTAGEFAAALRTIRPRLRADRTRALSPTGTQEIDVSTLIGDTTSGPANSTESTVRREEITSLRTLPAQQEPPLPVSVASSLPSLHAPESGPDTLPPTASSPIEPPAVVAVAESPGSFRPEELAIAPGPPPSRSSSRWMRPLLMVLGATILLASAFVMGRRSTAPNGVDNAPVSASAVKTETAPVVVSPVDVPSISTIETAGELPVSSTIIVEDSPTKLELPPIQAKPAPAKSTEPASGKKPNERPASSSVTTTTEIRTADRGDVEKPVLAPGKRGKRFVDTPEYKSDFSPVIIRYYDVLTQGDAVHWAWVAPGVKLVDAKIVIRPFRNLTSVKSERVMSWLLDDLQTALDEVTEERSGKLAITTEGAIYWAEDSRKKKRGIAVEMILRDSTGRIVAMIRHREYENSPEDAAEEVVEAVVDFVGDN